MIPGHEFAGTVAEIGPEFRRISRGDRVIADINVSCGQCFYCRKSEVLNCAEVSQIGIARDGAFAEFAVVPERLVIRIPDNMSFAVAAVTEPLACVVRAFRKSNVRFAESVLVLGLGPIGNLHVQLARAIGAAPIIGVDLNEKRREIAARAGADVVTGEIDNLEEIVLTATDGRGADVVIGASVFLHYMNGLSALPGPADALPLSAFRVRMRGRVSRR